MRLWSIHPSYLDPAGLVALWREALLARHVLEGRTRGYRHHPQLERFRGTPDPAGAVRTYLHAVADEADRRGYSFDRSRAGAPGTDATRIPVTEGQARFEWAWILEKTRTRSPEAHARLRALARDAGVEGFLPDPHPSFSWIPGDKEAWERGG